MMPEKAIFEGRATGDPTREHVTLLRDGMLVPLVDSEPYDGHLGDVVSVDVFATSRFGARRLCARISPPARPARPAPGTTLA